MICLQPMSLSSTWGSCKSISYVRSGSKFATCPGITLGPKTEMSFAWLNSAIPKLHLKKRFVKKKNTIIYTSPVYRFYFVVVNIFLKRIATALCGFLLGDLLEYLVSQWSIQPKFAWSKSDPGVFPSFPSSVQAAKKTNPSQLTTTMRIHLKADQPPRFNWKLEKCHLWGSWLAMISSKMTGWVLMFNPCWKKGKNESGKQTKNNHRFYTFRPVEWEFDTEDVNQKEWPQALQRVRQLKELSDKVRQHDFRFVGGGWSTATNLNNHRSEIVCVHWTLGQVNVIGKGSQCPWSLATPIASCEWFFHMKLAQQGGYIDLEYQNH